MTGLTARHRGDYGAMAGDTQRRVVNVRGSQDEPTRIDIGRAVAAGAIAVEAADGDVAPWSCRDRHVSKRGGHGGSVAAQAIRHSLVSARQRVQGIVARGRMTLSARSIGRNVVRRLAAAGYVTRESRGGRVTAETIPRRWMGRIQ